MRLLLAHDHRFYRGAADVLSRAPFEINSWTRYLRYFDNVTVMARLGGELPSGDMERLLSASSPNLDFELLPDISNLRGLTARRASVLRQIGELVSQSDAVVARLPSVFGVMAAREARRRNVPWVAEVVGCQWDALWYYGKLAANLYAPLAYLQMKSVVGASEHAIYVTSQFLQRRYPSRARNQAGVSDAAVQVAPLSAIDGRVVRQRETNRPLRVGLIGTLRGRTKGIQTAIEALATMRLSLPPMKLHVLGGGDIHEWRALAKRRGVADIVSFDGTLPSGSAVHAWLDGIDVYMQPSFQEGLPRALVEAMSRGCPAIGSTAGGIPELLSVGDTFPPGDVRALGALLARRLRDDEWMEQSSRRNWLVSQQYSSSELGARRDAFWLEFLRSAT